MSTPALESREAYLEYLMKTARTKLDAWWLRSERTGTEETRRTKLLATLRFHNQEHRLEEFEPHLRKEPLTSELSTDLKGVVKQVVLDLRDYLLPKDIARYERTTVGLLPLSGVDAFCIDRTLWEGKLDGYLVILNEGLFLCAQLLSKAFLFENLDGDLIAYKTSGVPTRSIAIEHFLAPSSRHANQVMFEGVPADIEGSLSAAQMTMTLILLQFVLLHEFGHVFNGDFELMEKYRFHIASAEESTSPVRSDQHWGAEYAADRYALSTICRNVRTDMSRWANFMCIYIFFDWLRSIEEKTGGPLCPLHPPPANRGKRLMRLMRQQVPLDDVSRQHVRQSLAILNSWSHPPGQLEVSANL
jgi:hypothetical protein